jgi:hypothetical protein
MNDLCSMNNHMPQWHTAVMMEEKKTDAQISADAIVGLGLLKLAPKALLPPDVA